MKTEQRGWVIGTKCACRCVSDWSVGSVCVWGGYWDVDIIKSSDKIIVHILSVCNIMVTSFLYAATFSCNTFL